MSKAFKKWDIVLVDLNPTKGAEIAKIRPCLIVSPNALNAALSTVIIIPLTSTIKNYPTRLLTNHKGKIGALAFDQIKTIDKGRIIKQDGELDKNRREAVNTLLQILFSEE
jgi:mRNA interferase MazF